MEFEQNDNFERELQQALQRRPAPPSLKRKIMELRAQRFAARRHTQWLVWQRLAAGVVLAAMLAGGMEWQVRRVEERRRGEEARRQVMTALRITGRALSTVHERLIAHDRGAD